MSRRHSRSRDNFDSGIGSVLSPIFVLVLAIASGMGVMAFVLSHGKESRELSSSESTRTLKRAEQKAPRRVLSTPSKPKEDEIRPELERSPAPQPRVVEREPREAVAKPAPVRAYTPARVERVVQRAPRPMPPKIEAIAKPAAPIDRPVIRESVVIVTKVVPAPRSPAMEDLSVPAAEAPAPKPVIRQSASLEPESKDNVFDFPPPKPSTHETMKLVPKTEAPKLEESPKKTVAVEVKASSSAQSFRDRLKKSKDEVAEESEEVVSQAATRGFQDRLKKSVK